MGPALLDEIAPALQVLFEAGRWYCGRGERDRPADDRAGAADRRPRAVHAGPDGRLSERSCSFPPSSADVVAELQRPASAKVLADPDPATIGDRAAAIFADRVPAWRHAAFQSVDLQIAAHDEAASRRATGSLSSATSTSGTNPLIQGVFAHRHPNPVDAPRRDPPTRSGRACRSSCRRGPGPWASRPAACRSRPMTRPDRRDARDPRAGRPADLAATRALGRRHRPRRPYRRAARLPLLDAFWLPIFVGRRALVRAAARGRPRAARDGRPHGAPRARAGASRPPRSRAGRGHRRLRARPGHAAPRVREVAARAKADVPRHREPGARLGSSAAKPATRSRRRAPGWSSPRCCRRRTGAGSPTQTASATSRSSAWLRSRARRRPPEPPTSEAAAAARTARSTSPGTRP